MYTAARHRCMIYAESPRQQLPYIASLLIQELQAGTRCIYFSSPEMLAAMRAHLSSVGMDVEAELDERTLILVSDRSHLVDGRFDSATMIDRVVATVADAEADGFLKLCIAADMTWEFGDSGDFTELLAYELASEQVYEQHPMLHAICLFHQDSLPPGTLQDALCSHRSVYLNQTLFAVNPYFTPLSAEPSGTHIPSDIGTLIERLRRHQ